MVSIMADLVWAMPCFPCSLFLLSKFPRSRYAFGHFVGLSFSPSMFRDWGDGPRSESAVCVRVGMGMAFCLFWRRRKHPSRGVPMLGARISGTLLDFFYCRTRTISVKILARWPRNSMPIVVGSVSDLDYPHPQRVDGLS